MVEQYGRPKIVFPVFLLCLFYEKTESDSLYTSETDDILITQICFPKGI